MDLNLSDTRNAIDVGQTLALIGLAAVTWLRKPGQQAQEQVKQLHKLFTEQTTELTKTVTDQHHALDKRMTMIEEQVQHMPTREEVAKLNGAVNTIDAKVSSVQQAAIVTHASVVRIEQFLMQGGRQ